MAGTNQGEFEGLSDGLDDILEPLDAGFSRPGVDEVDDMLDVIAREVNDNAEDMGPPPDRPRRESNISLDLDPAELEAFTGSLEESLAKFDEFLERATASNHGSDEFDDQLTELRPIETLREKRGRDSGSLQTSGGGGSGMPRIRNISGEKLSSMPALHHGYATTSSINKNSAAGSGKSAQKNQMWDTPEPVLGEVTGNKMRRLLSEQSYFQSRPVPNDASKNAPWNQPRTAPTVSARTAMQTLLNGGTSHTSTQAPQAASGGTSASAGWPAQKQSPMGGVTMSQMQQVANTGASQSSGFNQSSGVAQSARVAQVATVSLQDMQRLAATGASFPTQASTATASAGSTPQNTAQAQTMSWTSQQQKPAFASVSIQDMQRLANSGVSFSSQQGTTAVPGSVGQITAQTGGFVAPTPQPAFAAVSLQDMQRLAATGVAASAQQQAAAAHPSAMPPPKPMFASVTLQDMQRLATSGATFSTQAAAVPQQAASMGASRNTASNQAPTPWSTAQPVFSTRAAPAPASGNAVQNPPWAVPAQQSAAASNASQGVQQMAGTAGGITFQTSSNPMGGGSLSFGNVAQAAAAPKPVFATVSLEDMHRLASTGVSRPIAPVAHAQGASAVSQNAPWNAPKTSSGVATMGNVQHLTSANASSQAQTTPSATTTQQAAPKPTFASVTLEDMQRLVNAYSEHQKPASASAKETQNTPVAPKPSPMQETTAPRTEATAQVNVSRRDGGSPNNVSNSTNAVGARANVSLASTTNAVESKDENVICADAATPPKKVSGGSMQRMMSEASYFQNADSEAKSTGAANAAWPDAVTSKVGTSKSGTDSDSSGTPTEDSGTVSSSDPDEMLKKLRSLMDRSSATQQALQDFDKKRGLPRSHSQTMVNSSRSRKQLLEGKIIAKWDGSPLISDETELGKPRPRASSKKTEGTKQKSETQTNVPGSAATAFAAV